MRQIVVCAILSMMLTILPAYAFIPIMDQSEREQLFNKVPNFQGSNINYFFQIIITPTGAQESNVVLDLSNYTALKNNVGFFTACGGFNNGLCQPPVPTTAPVTTNYCPLAKMILTNEDGYLSKLYNTTKGVDMTGLMYPSYCYTETGANPINGDNTIPIPEFPLIAEFVIIISIIGSIIIGSKLRK